VSTTRLEVPKRARSDYKKACDEFKQKKLAAAEEDVRSAIQDYPDYVAAWVMLGEVLAAKEETDHARNACEHAQTTDSTYLPSYLCLTQIALKNEQWEQVLSLTTKALDLNPQTDAYAYFYRAVAFFHLKNLPEAQANALEAVRIDKTYRQTTSCSLLAQIYEAEGDARQPSECRGR